MNTAPPNEALAFEPRSGLFLETQIGCPGPPNCFSGGECLGRIQKWRPSTQSLNGRSR